MSIWLNIWTFGFNSKCLLFFALKMINECKQSTKQTFGIKLNELSRLFCSQTEHFMSTHEHGIIGRKHFCKTQKHIYLLFSCRLNDFLRHFSNLLNQNSLFQHDTRIGFLLVSHNSAFQF